ncbi:hypothetical protein C461_14800 [Halorubrum aidingense JCM 13560]|uniref:RnhA operon protein n=1 Tax=Halorubrum aidingense JCM 13560 TaxID=1230454 RepID=M0P8H9_9EURY|nr:hypothetical protein [Halorubrum aidingense]EMA65120.1 hypothetical protein C461_14800 [Halorubrum aidingense JCM 13560]
MTRTNDEPPEWAKERAREVMAAEEDAAAAEESDGAAEGDGGDDSDRIPDIPAEAVDEAERLTRLARETTDEAAAAFYRERRDELAAGHDYVPRLREDDDTLVLYPDEWMADGTVQLDRIETTDRAVEVSLSGPGDADRYREIAAYNEAVADAVAERAADVHADTARTFAAFMSNHYVRAVDDASPDVRAEFREEFLPRNGWPTDEQLAVVDESLSVIADIAADVDGPE